MMGLGGLGPGLGGQGPWVKGPRATGHGSRATGHGAWAGGPRGIGLRGCVDIGGGAVKLLLKQEEQYVLIGVLRETPNPVCFSLYMGKVERYLQPEVCNLKYKNCILKSICKQECLAG